MDKKYFESLPEDIQKAVEEAANYASKEISEKQLAASETAEKSLIDMGCTVIEVDTDEFAAYFDGFAEQNFPYLKDWVGKIKAMDTEK